jgi:hypothetical protein
MRRSLNSESLFLNQAHYIGTNGRSDLAALQSHASQTIAHLEAPRNDDSLPVVRNPTATNHKQMNFVFFFLFYPSSTHKTALTGSCFAFWRACFAVSSRKLENFVKQGLVWIQKFKKVLASFDNRNSAPSTEEKLGPEARPIKSLHAHTYSSTLMRKQKRDEKYFARKKICRRMKRIDLWIVMDYLFYKSIGAV